MDPISAGISAVSSLFKGITGLIAGNRQAQALRNAATQTLDEAGVNASNTIAEGNAQAAEGAAIAAANGGGFVGSSIGVIQGLASRAYYNARTQVYRGQTEAQRLRYQAGVVKAQALQGLISNSLQAGSSLMGGFAKGGQANQLTKLSSQLSAGGDFSGGAEDMAGLY